MTPVAESKEKPPFRPELKFTLKTVDKNNDCFYDTTTMNGGLVFDGLEKSDDGYRAKLKRDDGTFCYGLITGCFETKNGYELVTEVQFSHTLITVTSDNEEAYKIAKELCKNIFKVASTHCP